MTGNGVRVDVRNLTKRFGSVAAVTDLTFSVAPGVVTGFLGPNGSGKTTTMRMILGLVTATSGRATIGGVRYSELPSPVTTVGAVLDGVNAHPAWTARDHLRLHATMGRLPHRRVETVIRQLGMTTFADRPTREYSTGMKQRLSLATALLGDPRLLLLDEPGNGLDPQGAAWLRDLLKELAADGRTILISSHVLSELEQMVEHVVVIRDGRLVISGSVEELSGVAGSLVLVRSPDADQLGRVLREHVTAAEGTVQQDASGLLRVAGLGTADIARIAAIHNLRVHELTPQRSSLERVFLTLTDREHGVE